METKEFITSWPDEIYYQSGVLFVQRLKKCEHPLSDEQIAEVLKAIDETCNHCWDAPDGCRCWDDS